MWNYLWPILVVIGSNTIYHISAKVIPKGIHPFISLTITYILAAIASVILFFVTRGDTTFMTEVRKANWTSILLGIAVVGLEFGYLQVYRAGWDLSIASLVANIGLAFLLLLVGAMWFEEAFRLKQLLGFLFCIIGIVLINLK